jgi:hypothetical protein
MTVFQKIQTSFQNISATEVLIDILYCILNLSEEAYIEIYVDSDSKARVKIKRFALEPELIQSSLEYLSKESKLISSMDIEIADTCKEVYLSNFNGDYEFIWIQKGSSKTVVENRGPSSIHGMLIGIDFDLALLEGGLSEAEILDRVKADHNITVN